MGGRARFRIMSSVVSRVVLEEVGVAYYETEDGYLVYEVDEDEIPDLVGRIALWFMEKGGVGDERRAHSYARVFFMDRW